MAISDLIQIVSWSLWIVAGVVVALVATGFSCCKRMVIYNLLVGISLAVIGGVASALSDGDATKGQLIVSVLVACLYSGAGVFVLNMLARPTRLLSH